jgi:hypothetical protein
VFYVQQAIERKMANRCTAFKFFQLTKVIHQKWIGSGTKMGLSELPAQISASAN